MKQKFIHSLLVLGVGCVLIAGCAPGLNLATPDPLLLSAERTQTAGSQDSRQAQPLLETPSPEANVEWDAIDCSSGEWVQPGSADGREIGLALQRGIARYPEFQPLFFPQIYDTFGKPWIFQLPEWAVVSTGFQWIEGAQFVLRRTPSGYEYFDYFVAGEVSSELPAQQEFDRMAGLWPNIPPEVIACFPWGEMESEPASVKLAELADVDCSQVEWIDPQAEQGRQIGQRLLSVSPRPLTIEEAFVRVGPIEKVGDWILYQAERDIGTVYVLGPTFEGPQFFGEGWMRMTGDETLTDVQSHLLGRLPDVPLPLVACLQPEPWLFGQKE